METCCSHSCLLCFQVIEDNILDPENEYSNHKEMIFKCCCRLLGEKIKGSTFNWSYSKDSCSPFCSTCFTSSENLWKLENRLIKFKTELDAYVETFSTEILESRSLVLSKKFSTALDDVEDDDSDHNNLKRRPVNQSNSNVGDATSTCNDNFTSPSEVPSSAITTETGVDAVKVEVYYDDVLNEAYFVDDYDSDGLKENTGKSSPFVNDIEDDEQFKSQPSEGGESCSQSQISTKTKFKEVRVNLKRLQLDSEGKVKVPTFGQIKFKKEAEIEIETEGQTNSALKNCSSKTTKTIRLSKIRGNDDEEFIIGDLYSDSERSESNEEPVSIRRKFRKTSVIGNPYKELKCIVCSSLFKSAAELDGHSLASGHINERPVECQKCSKRFYRNKDLSWHRKVCSFRSKTCTICDIVLNTYEKYKHHKRKHENNALIDTPVRVRKEKVTTKVKGKAFKCVECPSDFHFAKELDSHSQKSGHVNERNFKCTNCHKAYYRQIDLKYHERKNCSPANKVYNCEECNVKFPSYIHYYQHMKTHEEWNSKPNKLKIGLWYSHFKCIVCSLEFSTPKELDVHSKEAGHKNVRLFRCKSCPHKFYRRMDLGNHKKLCHSEISRNCPVCNKEFKTYSKYYCHVQTHKPKIKRKKISIDRNGGTKRRIRKTENTRHMNEHMQSSGKVKKQKYKCEQCGIEISSWWGLRDHRADHLDKTKIQCNLCHLFYKNEDALELHVWRRHSEDYKDFECDSCDAKFGEMQHYVAHRISDHGMESPYRCRHCPNSFSYKSDLNRHIFNAHGEKPPKKGALQNCTVCDEMYKGRALYLHILTHTTIPKEVVKEFSISGGQKGHFQCEECGKIFASKKAMLTHAKRVHSKTKYSEQFVCKICGRQLSSANTLRVHSRIHNEQKKVVCELCGRGFNTNCHLKRHSRLIHDQNKTPRKSYTKTPFSQPK